MTKKERLASRLSQILLLLAVLSVSVLAETGSPMKDGGSIARIEQAYKAGAITYGDRIFYDLQAVLKPGELPLTFQVSTAEIIRCGTPYVNQAIENWQLMKPEQQAQAAGYMARPATDSAYVSPEHKFLIHYSITGLDSVPATDDNGNQVPDYVERIALYADSSFRHYHQNLNYLPHPSDGDSLYDIYLLKIGAYGVTVREQAADSPWNDWTSYIQVHCTFAGFPTNQDPEGNVIGAQKVTCAHEYYHAVEFAYDGSEDVWWSESCATYFEEVVFSVVNDNYSYLPFFFNYPDTFLNSTGYHMYGTWVWPQYLAEKFGLNTIKSIWESCRFYSSLAATDSTLAPAGNSVTTIFPEFTLWNYLTGSRHDTVSYDSGGAYPMVPLDRTVPSCPFSGVTPNHPPDGLSANYIVTYPDTTVNGLLKIDFDGANEVQWGFAYIAFKGGQMVYRTDVPVDFQGKTSAGIYDFVAYDSIVFIPSVVSQWQNNNGYAFNTVIYPIGDVNGSGDLNILDVSYLISFIYKSGPAPKYDYYMGDVTCSGNINVLDLIYLINNLYKSGPEPCMYKP